MKTMKKLAGAALALILTLALAAPAMAAEVTIDSPDLNDGTLTGTETFTAYKIFDASVAGEGDTDPNRPGNEFSHVAYSIDKDSPFFATIQGFQYNGETVFGLEDIANSTKKNVENKALTGSAVASLAEALQAVIADPNVTIDDAYKTSVADNKINLEDGYFLIVGSLGSKAILDTVGKGDVTIKTKNVMPTMTKKIVEGEDRVDSTTASYGDTVTFEIAVSIPNTAVGPMTVHDVMDSNLAYVGLTDDSFAAAVANGTETGEGVTVCTKEFTISAEQVAANLGGTVAIQYTATLNSDAPIATSIPNTAHLTYYNYKTPDDTVEVFTYQFDLLKTNDDKAPLAGAKFSLGMDLVKVEEEENVYRVAVAGDATDTIVTEFTTDATGKILIKGLKNGTYTLTEVAAPDGYNKLKNPVEVVINNGNNMVAENAESETGYTGTHIINKTGLELPETGGIGTTIFYVVGGLLVVGAGVLLVTKRRMSGEEE